METFETECGYFGGLTMSAEACLLTGLDFDALLAAGFRRSGGIAYRADCPSCGKCVPIRIRAADFVPSRSQRKVLRRNADVEISFTADPRLFATDEKARLYAAYKARHGGEATAEEAREELRGIAEGYSGTVNMDYRLGGRLVGCGIVDAGERSLSSNYFYYDTSPEIMARSLGTFSLLKEIELCRSLGAEFHYLGYYIADCRKMNYKARFRPHQLRDRGTGAWRTADVHAPMN